MTISAYGLPREVIANAITSIENNPVLAAYLRKVVKKPVNLISKLSARRVDIVEDQTGIRIEEAPMDYELSIGLKKKRSLIAFFALRPWLHVNCNRPHESIIEWLLLYKEIGQIKPGEINEGKSIVIRSDGAIEIE